jgi:hypothetical protein
MISKNSFQTLLLVIASSTLLIACGGGGGGGDALSSGSSISFDGNTEPARIDDSNAQEIGEAAGETVGGANEGSSVPLPFGIELGPVETIESMIPEITELALLYQAPSAVTFDMSNEFCSSGRLIVDLNNTSGSGPATLKMNFTNCVLPGVYNYTYDGRATVVYNDLEDLDAGYRLTMNNFSISGGPFNQDLVMNYSLVCESVGDCITSSNYVASNGYTHQLSEASISGTNSTGLDGTATFYHEVHGGVTITITNLTFGDCGSMPDGGSISFSSTSGTSGTINFASNCTVSGTWNTGTGSGSF